MCPAAWPSESPLPQRLPGCTATRIHLRLCLVRFSNGDKGRLAHLLRRCHHPRRSGTGRWGLSTHCVKRVEGYEALWLWARCSVHRVLAATGSSGETSSAPARKNCVFRVQGLRFISRFLRPVPPNAGQLVDWTSANTCACFRGPPSRTDELVLPTFVKQPPRRVGFRRISSQPEAFGRKSAKNPLPIACRRCRQLGVHIRRLGVHGDGMFANAPPKRLSLPLPLLPPALWSNLYACPT